MILKGIMAAWLFYQGLYLGKPYRSTIFLVVYLSPNTSSALSLGDVLAFTTKLREVDTNNLRSAKGLIYVHSSHLHIVRRELLQKEFQRISSFLLGEVNVSLSLQYHALVLCRKLTRQKVYAPHDTERHIMSSRTYST